MVTVSERICNVRNTTCIVCGAAFDVPRAGKLFCSAKCKQFRYYHREEIKGLEQSHKGISNENHCLSIREYDLYCSTVKQLNEYTSLNRKSLSPHLKLNSEDLTRYNDLIDEIPKYLLECRIPALSIEQWSFIKLLYPSLRKDEFFKLVHNLSSTFFNRLVYAENNKSKVSKADTVANLYRNHILKIVSGKIRFE